MIANRRRAIDSLSSNNGNESEEAYLAAVTGESWEEAGTREDDKEEPDNKGGEETDEAAMPARSAYSGEEA